MIQNKILCRNVDIIHFIAMCRVSRMCLMLLALNFSFRGCDLAGFHAGFNRIKVIHFSVIRFINLFILPSFFALHPRSVHVSGLQNPRIPIKTVLAA